MESIDMTQKNIEKIGALFPDVITEMRDEGGKLIKGINFELLKWELSGEVVDGEECYDFTWAGKRNAVLEANIPIRKTLRPSIEESKEWEETGNLYIEGDNLDALKLLQESYLNSIKMIFIDPPYNTGKDSFVYPDNYTLDKEDYESQIEYRDEESNILFKQNNGSNPRFHSDWCSMFYSRIKLAHNLLTEDGIIFITLDDGENSNARQILNQVFGEDNFITEFIWEKKKKPSFLHRNIGKLFDYVLCYGKNAVMTKPFSVERTTEGKKYPFNNAGNGESIITFPPLTVDFAQKELIIEPQDMSEGNIKTELMNRVEVSNYKNQTEIILKGEWRYSQKKINEIIENGEQISISKIPFRPNHIKTGGEIKKMKNILSPTHYNCETNEDGTKQIIDLFGKEVFDTPKPLKLLKILIQAVCYDDKDAIVLDFFSGSATTAHSLMLLNSEDGGNRKFVMVQLPEPCDPDSIAFECGYSNISDIGKDRIRFAGDKINTEIEEKNSQIKIGEESKPLIDIGFRVLKVDSTNMKDVYYAASEYNQGMLAGLESNIKEDRTDLDLLYGVLLDWGLPLSLSHKIEKIEGITVHTVDEGSLVACFADKVSENIVREIAKRQPLRVVFRDSSFANSPDKINVEEIFKLHAPNTTVKVI